MESQQTEPTKETSHPEKKSLAKRTATFIKNRVKNYIKNLNPIGKDKFWWMGNLLSSAGTAALFLTGPPGAHKMKALASAAVSVGLYAGERAMEKHRNKNWTEERRAEWAAKRQEKFPHGTSRIKRFLLGVSAGGIYGAGFGEIWLGYTSPEGFHPIKNIERHIDTWKKKSMTDQLLQPVIERLQKQGETEDQIAQTLASLTQAATVLLYKQALEALSDEDMQKIEDCPDDQAANKLIADLYAQKVGTSPEELLEVFLKEFVKEFLEEN